MKDLAVLIAVYNDEEALWSALDSIDEPDNSFTVVVVDGGSDVPPQVEAGRYPFEVLLVQQGENTGLAGGLNVGIDFIRERGFRYLARFDAGDLSRKGRLSTQYRRFQERDDLVMLGSNAVFVEESTGEPLFETNLPQTWEQIRKWSVFRTCFIHPTVMLRLDLLDPSFKYDLRYPHIEDYVLFTRIAERYPSEVLAEPLVDCYMRASGISRRSERAQLISGIRHHLRHPKPLNPLWYAYLAKRLVYLAVPYGWRKLPKRCLGMVRRAGRAPAAGASSLVALAAGLLAAASAGGALLAGTGERTPTKPAAVSAVSAVDGPVVTIRPGEVEQPLVLLGHPPGTHFDARGVRLRWGGAEPFGELPQFRLLTDPAYDPAAGIGYPPTEELAARRRPNEDIYPLQVRDMESPSLSGAAVVGVQPRELPWRVMKTVYDGDGLVVRHCTGHAVVSDVYFENVEDGFGPQEHLERWTLRRAYMRYIRDDAVENDYLIPGEIVDSLIDGCFVFLSHRPEEVVASEAVTAVRRCLVHVEAQPHDGYEERGWRDRYIAIGGEDGIGRAPGMLFKWQEGAGSVVVEDSVLRVDGIAWSGPDDMVFPPGVYRDVTLVWLGPGPYPQPLPPGVTLTRDRRVWEEARDAWIRALDPEHPAAPILRSESQPPQPRE